MYVERERERMQKRDFKKEEGNERQYGREGNERQERETIKKRTERKHK